MSCLCMKVGCLLFRWQGCCNRSLDCIGRSLVVGGRRWRCRRFRLCLGLCCFGAWGCCEWGGW